ncbi:MAG: hypothetical protein RMM28_07335 [Thermoleophilia bacterium]|nr:hypothetical protein [Gaiellaceae bacterium]MDW8338932.1 hypothetical protein [Thermoleophilia bacterium]
MERAELELILRQAVPRAETPRDRRERDALDEDLRALARRPLRARLLGFRPRAEAYLAASRGPLPYMVRLHEIERRLAELEERCRAEWRALAATEPDPLGFARSWSSYASSLDLEELNDLIDRHNRWYPIEAQLPMDPTTGDFVLVNGRDYRRPRIDVGWLLARFPPERERALS